MMIPNYVKQSSVMTIEAKRWLNWKFGIANWCLVLLFTRKLKQHSAVKKLQCISECDGHKSRLNWLQNENLVNSSISSVANYL